MLGPSLSMRKKLEYPPPWGLALCTANKGGPDVRWGGTICTILTKGGPIVRLARTICVIWDGVTSTLIRRFDDMCLQGLAPTDTSS